jgi:membrane protease YdiL (CAAX protease family)
VEVTSNVHKIVWYVLLAYLFSWIWWVPMALAGVVVPSGQGWPTHLFGLMGPAFAAFAVTAWTEGRAGLADLWARIVRWRIRWYWYALVAATASLMVIPLLTSPDVSGDDLVLYSGAPASGLAVVFYVLIVNGFGEEIGWRGFLADHLLTTTSRAKTALIIWPIWAGWHLPLFWIVGSFRDFGIGGTIGWLVGIGFGSVFLTWLYQSANYSILIVALWHTAYNFTTATAAAAGAAAAIASMVVIAASLIILCFPSSWRHVRTAVASADPKPSNRI